MSESTAGPEPRPSGHPSVETIADSLEGLLPPEQAAALALHLAECDECTETSAALTEIQSLLGRAEAPTLPDDVATRIDAALASEAVSRANGSRPHPLPAPTEPSRHAGAQKAHSAPPAAPPGPPGPGRDGTGDRPSPSPGSHRPGRAPGRLLRRAGLGIAVLAAVGGITTALVYGGGGSGGTRSSSGAEAGAAQSGPVFTRNGLAQQIRSLVPEESGRAPSGSAIGPKAQHQGAASPDAAAVPACVLLAVRRDEPQPLAESRGSYQGTPVYALVYGDAADPQGSLDAYLVDASCSVASTDTGSTTASEEPGKVLLEQTVPRR